MELAIETYDEGGVTHKTLKEIVQKEETEEEPIEEDEE